MGLNGFPKKVQPLWVFSKQTLFRNSLVVLFWLGRRQISCLLSESYFGHFRPQGHMHRLCSEPVSELSFLFVDCVPLGVHTRAPGLSVAMPAAKRAKVDNLLAGCQRLSASRPQLLRLEADFVTCTQ